MTRLRPPMGRHPLTASRRKSVLLAGALVALGLGGGLAGASPSLPPPVQQALAVAGIPRENVAVFVHPVDGPAPLLARNADTPMNPASTMKLITTFAALELLGPAYTWKTEVYVGGPVAQGVLNGSLAIKGYGDPKLTLERLWLLLREVRARGVRVIRGDLVLDRSHFALPAADPGAFDGEPYRPYNVEPDALLLNFNAVRVHFVPEPADGRVRVYAEPHPEGLEIENRLTLGPGPCRDWEPRFHAAIVSDWTRAWIVFDGRYPESCGEKAESFSVLAHPRLFGDVFRQLWTELGGRLEGEVREGPVPEGARLLAASESPPLAEIVRDINKFSNNVMARQLLLTLGAYGFGAPATPETAVRAIKAWLLQNRLEFPELVVENGAGLSRIERVSARHLGELLLRAWNSPVMPEFVASLPLAGVDGTLKKRMRANAFSGQAHLKTGYLEGVRAIAGYVRDSAGQRHVVVCFINHPNAGRARPFMEAVIEWVYGDGPKKR
jgi:D-alanyl-D-alanine carboxypeptidase/D-alanyl-D-alanine-endopeptidase (penicillin-binding protein 4)